MKLIKLFLVIVIIAIPTLSLAQNSDLKGAIEYVAWNDKNWKIREIAVCMLTKKGALEHIIVNEKNDAVRKAAIVQLAKIST